MQTTHLQLNLRGITLLREIQALGNGIDINFGAYNGAGICFRLTSTVVRKEVNAGITSIAKQKETTFALDGGWKNATRQTLCNWDLAVSL